jgi:ATP:corrinoid adenosyltransferase
MQDGKTVFVGRFLTDLALPDTTFSRWQENGVTLRQYGNSYYVNACPALADARRVELGVEESETILREGKHDVVLLSQILSANDETFLSCSDIVRLVEACPKHVSLILTGDQFIPEITENYKGENLPLPNEKP